MKNDLFLIKKGFFKEMDLDFDTDLSIKDHILKNKDKDTVEKNL